MNYDYVRNGFRPYLPRGSHGLKDNRRNVACLTGRSDVKTLLVWREYTGDGAEGGQRILRLRERRLYTRS
jgi:hypothetical protein